MDQNDLQHIAMVLLETHINLGRAIRENARLNEEVAKRGGNDTSAVPPGAKQRAEEK